MSYDQECGILCHVWLAAGIVSNNGWCILMSVIFLIASKFPPLTIKLWSKARES